MEGRMQQTPVIEIPTEPLSFHVTLWANIRRLGPAELEVTRSGLRLRCKYKSVAPPDGILEVPWSNLRELKNWLRDDRSFVANFGDEFVITVNVKDATPDRITSLSGVFDRLPPEISASRCPSCSGPVLNDICRDCGKSFIKEQRTKGSKRIAVGGLLLGVGLLLTISTYNSAGGTVVVFYGMMLVGAYYLVTGLLRLVFGVRAS
jgi:hypothetical protein